MQRYHDTSADPLPLHSPQHDAERDNLARLTAAFLADGGQIEQIGHCMSNAPVTFSINPERSPVYAHLFAPATPAAAPEPVLVADTSDQRAASLIMAAAALGDSPQWIARKLHMTEKHVRQIARDYQITFHKQR